eukprot:5514716-Amphidinium_carterae.1
MPRGAAVGLLEQRAPARRGLNSPVHQLADPAVNPLSPARLTPKRAHQAACAAVAADQHGMALGMARRAAHRGHTPPPSVSLPLSRGGRAL